MIDFSLKLKPIDRCLFSAPTKGRSQCYASLHCEKYGYLGTWHITIPYNASKNLNRDGSHVVEYLLHLENKRQIMPNNVETKHKHMYYLYIGSLCNIVFLTCISHFTCIMTSEVFVKNLNAMKQSIELCLL